MVEFSLTLCCRLSPITRKRPKVLGTANPPCSNNLFAFFSLFFSRRAPSLVFCLFFYLSTINSYHFALREVLQQLQILQILQIRQILQILQMQQLQILQMLQQLQQLQILQILQLLQILNNYWMRLSMISWIIKTEVCVICRSRRLRQITQTRGFDNSWFHAKTEFNNCFIIHLHI